MLGVFIFVRAKLFTQIVFENWTNRFADYS